MATDDGTPPRAAEAVEVVLARMDGKLDRIWDKFSDLDPRVGKLEDRMKIQENLTLTLSKDWRKSQRPTPPRAHKRNRTNPAATRVSRAGRQFNDSSPSSVVSASWRP